MARIPLREPILKVSRQRKRIQETHSERTTVIFRLTGLCLVDTHLSPGQRESGQDRLSMVQVAKIQDEPHL
jgi:hypothetical protein